MSRIVDLPLSDRPREKAYRYGIKTLSNHELLAILIGSGYRDTSAVDVAYQMLSESHGLFSLVNKPYTDLINFKGIGKSKAIKIIAAFELVKRFEVAKNEEVKIRNSQEVYQRYKPLLADESM